LLIYFDDFAIEPSDCALSLPDLVTREVYPAQAFCLADRLAMAVSYGTMQQAENVIPVASSSPAGAGDASPPVQNGSSSSIWNFKPAMEVPNVGSAAR